MRSRAFFLAFLLLLPVAAEGVVCPQAVPLEEGLVAPCDGILWPEPWTATALECPPRLRICDVERMAVLEANGECEADLRTLQDGCSWAFDRLSKISMRAAGIERPWWEHPLLWGLVGVTVGVAGTYVVFKSGL